MAIGVGTKEESNTMDIKLNYTSCLLIKNTMCRDDLPDRYPEDDAGRDKRKAS